LFATLFECLLRQPTVRAQEGRMKQALAVTKHGSLYHAMGLYPAKAT
jgi:hypothetical protein